MSDHNNRIYSTIETDEQVVDRCVPVNELKELIEEWESKLDNIPSSAGRRAMELAKAADLKELVEEYE